MNGIVKIKLTGRIENREKGFYLLITTGETYSCKKNEFTVPKEGLIILKENEIKHKVIK